MLINSMSKNLRTIFLLPAAKMCNNGDKNKMDDYKVGIIRNEILFLWIYSMCKLRQITHKRNMKPSVCE